MVMLVILLITIGAIITVLVNYIITLRKKHAKFNKERDKWFDTIENTNLKTADLTTLKSFVSAIYLYNDDNSKLSEIVVELNNRGYKIASVSLGEDGVEFPFVIRK